MATEDIQFEPAWNYPDGYIIREPRPPKPVAPIRYVTERAAEIALEALLSPYFELHRQVRLTETGYPPQYIDYVAVLPEGMTFKFFGIEVKSGFEQVHDACDAIQQAMRYRKARLSDPRVALSRFLGDRPPFVFLWPELTWYVTPSPVHGPDAARWQSLSQAKYAGEARALSLFAARFNIGQVCSTPRWDEASWEWKRGASLMNGQQNVWTSRGFDGLESFGPGAQHGSKTSRGLRYVE
jgi:hypothetical protein